MKKRISIYKQYLLLFCLMPGLVLLIGLLNGALNYRIHINNQEVFYKSEAHKISSLLEQSLDYIERFSDLIGKKLYNKNQIEIKEIAEILKSDYMIASLSEEVKMVALFDFVSPDGKVVANSSDGILMDNLQVSKEQRSWMETSPKNPWVLQVSPHVVRGIINDKAIEEIGIPVGFGVTNKDKKFLGVISAGIDLKKFIKAANQSLANNSTKFLLLSDKGEVIVRNNSSLISEKTKITLPMSSIFSSNNIELDDVEYSYAVKIKKYPFIILIGKDSFINEKDLQKLVIIPIFLATSISLLLILLFWFFKNKLINPIQSLSEIADSISGGNFDIDVPEFKYSEIENLARKIRGIKIYAKQISEAKVILAENKAELIRLNNNLEQKVVERTKELTEALAIKEEFLNNISHEIRSPIQGVSSISEELLEKWDHFSEDKKYHYMSILASNAKRLFSLVANLLDFSKYRKSEPILDIRKFDLSGLIKEVLDECKNIYFFNKKINFKFDSNEGLMIEADRERLAQVIRNLVINAIKYSPEGSLIEAQITKKTKKGKWVKVSVIDQGVGIPKDEIESIFLAFSQSSITKTKAGGTGLGLAICKSIIDAHKGEIWAENNKQLGANFSFMIPVTQISKDSSLARNNKDKLTIMIIDDEKDTISSIELMLHNENYIIMSSTLAMNGFYLVKENSKKIDLILLDLMMPDAHGLTILEKLKNEDSTKNIPIIIQSGVANEDEKKKCFELGARGFISKPFNKRDLLRKINELY